MSDNFSYKERDQLIGSNTLKRDWRKFNRSFNQSSYSICKKCGKLRQCYKSLCGSCYLNEIKGRIKND